MEGRTKRARVAPDAFVDTLPSLLLRYPSPGEHGFPPVPALDAPAPHVYTDAILGGSTDTFDGIPGAPALANAFDPNRSPSDTPMAARTGGVLVKRLYINVPAPNSFLNTRENLARQNQYVREAVGGLCARAHRDFTKTLEELTCPIEAFPVVLTAIRAALSGPTGDSTSTSADSSPLPGITLPSVRRIQLSQSNKMRLAPDAPLERFLNATIFPGLRQFIVHPSEVISDDPAGVVARQLIDHARVAFPDLEVHYFTSDDAETLQGAAAAAAAANNPALSAVDAARHLKARFPRLKAAINLYSRLDFSACVQYRSSDAESASSDIDQATEIFHAGVVAARGAIPITRAINSSQAFAFTAARRSFRGPDQMAWLCNLHHVPYPAALLALLMIGDGKSEERGPRDYTGDLHADICDAIQRDPAGALALIQKALYVAPRLMSSSDLFKRIYYYASATARSQEHGPLSPAFIDDIAFIAALSGVQTHLHAAECRIVSFKREAPLPTTNPIAAPALLVGPPSISLMSSQKEDTSGPAVLDTSHWKLSERVIAIPALFLAAITSYQHSHEVDLEYEDYKQAGPYDDTIRAVLVEYGPGRYARPLWEGIAYRLARGFVKSAGHMILLSESAGISAPFFRLEVPPWPMLDALHTTQAIVQLSPALLLAVRRGIASLLAVLPATEYTRPTLTKLQKAVDTHARRRGFV